MFEVGFTEIVLIFGIALLVLGPARLPKLAADLGRWAGRARAMARTLRTQLEQEVQQIDPLATPKSASTGYTPAASPVPAAATPAEPAQGAAVGGAVAPEPVPPAAAVTPVVPVDSVRTPAPADVETHAPRQDGP